MTLEPFAARLLIASRGDLIEEILRLRGELAASERDRERHDATVILWEQATADRERLRAELAATQAERDAARAQLAKVEGAQGWATVDLCKAHDEMIATLTASEWRIIREALATHASKFVVDRSLEDAAQAEATLTKLLARDGGE